MTKSWRTGTTGEIQYYRTHHQEAWCFFYLCENQRFSLNFFNRSALNIIKQVEENTDEETQYVKCDHWDKNANFKNNLSKISLIQTYYLIVMYTKNTMILKTALLTMISVFNHPSKIYKCEYYQKRLQQMIMLQNTKQI